MGRCLSCAQKQRYAKHKTDKPAYICSVCGIPSWQNPCPKCTRTPEIRKLISDTLLSRPKNKVCRLCGRLSVQDPCSRCAMTPEVRRRNSINRKRLEEEKPNTCYLCGKATYQVPCYSCRPRRTVSDERRAQMSKTMKDLHAAGLLKKSNVARKRWWANPDSKVWHGRIVKRALDNPETRKKMSNSAKLRVARDGVNVPHGPSSLEISISNVLTKMGVEFSTEYIIPGSRWRYDFYVSKHNLLIECDGIYWHSFPEQKVRDADKTQLATENGYKLLRIPGDVVTELGSDMILTQVWDYFQWCCF